MKRTSPTSLVVLFLVGAGAGWLVEFMLVGSGRPTLPLPFTLATALGLIGILVVVLALPVWRVVRRVHGAKVDPFYATRIVLLAKASSLTGSLLTGAAAAIVVFLLTRSVVASGEPIVMAVVTVVGAALLLIGGLVAEKMCTLPPEDEDSRPGQALT